jgi:hypothetical protein
MSLPMSLIFAGRNPTLHGCLTDFDHASILSNGTTHDSTTGPTVSWEVIILEVDIDLVSGNTNVHVCRCLKAR